jgi:hypothetical protein
MKTFSRFLVLMFACTCVTLLAKVVVDYSQSTDFSKYHTYSWLKVQAGDPLWPDRIKAAVDSQLVAKGWQKVADGGDASISAFGATQTQPRLETFYTGFGGGWRWRGFDDGMAVTTVDKEAVGTLVVDIFDTPTKKLIWRATATDALTDNPDKNEKKMDKAIAEMFKNFPPKPKG